MYKDKKIKLRVQPKYTLIMSFVIVLIFCIFLIFPSFIWEYKEGLFELWHIAFSICLAFSIFSFIKNIQFAILDEEKISIRGIFYTIAKVKWSEIYSIEEITIGTHESRGIPMISYKWLVIHLQKKEPEIKRGGINKRNKPPWQIIATKKNKELIQKYHSITKPLYEDVIDNLKSKKHK